MAESQPPSASAKSNISILLPVDLKEPPVVRHHTFIEHQFAGLVFPFLVSYHSVYFILMVKSQFHFLYFSPQKVNICHGNVAPSLSKGRRRNDALCDPTRMFTLCLCWPRLGLRKSGDTWAA
jgi:hypothetical protein